MGDTDNTPFFVTQFANVPTPALAELSAGFEADDDGDGRDELSYRLVGSC